MTDREEVKREVARLIASAHEAGRRSRDAEFCAVVEQRQEAQGRHNIEVNALAAKLKAAEESKARALEMARELAESANRIITARGHRACRRRRREGSRPGRTAFGGTMSNPTFVRLPIAIDSEHPERCGVCQRLTTYLSGRAACSEYGYLEWGGFDGHNRMIVRPSRHTACLSATAAEDARGAVVVAAKEHVGCSRAPGAGILDEECEAALVKAVDALRAIEGERENV